MQNSDFCDAAKRLSFTTDEFNTLNTGSYKYFFTPNIIRDCFRFAVAQNSAD